jgi:transcriptional regulator with XRE-family HTH domain
LAKIFAGDKIMYERIKALCKEAGYTIQALEILTHIGNGAIGKWRTQSPRAENLHRVAQALNTTVEYLLTGSGPAHPAKGNVDLFIVTEDGETAAYLQKVKDEEGIMFDLSKVSSIDEIKATVAFLKTLRGEGRDD